MDDQVLQNLLRSAHHCELPSADAVERFIEEFHRRQSCIVMKPSFWKKIQEQLETFFSNFHLPALAYATATAVALFLSIVILRSPQLNHPRARNTAPLFSEELEAPLNYVSSPALQKRLEPVSFDLKKKNSGSDDLISPLSFILKRKAHSSSFKNFNKSL